MYVYIYVCVYIYILMLVSALRGPQFPLLPPTGMESKPFPQKASNPLPETNGCSLLFHYSRVTSQKHESPFETPCKFVMDRYETGNISTKAPIK